MLQDALELGNAAKLKQGVPRSERKVSEWRYLPTRWLLRRGCASRPPSYQSARNICALLVYLAERLREQSLSQEMRE